MSLFILSICIKEWNIAEETDHFIRFEFEKGDSRIFIKPPLWLM